MKYSWVVLMLCVVVGWYSDEVIGWLRTHPSSQPTSKDPPEADHG